MNAFQIRSAGRNWTVNKIFNNQSNSPIAQLSISLSRPYWQRTVKYQKRTNSINPVFNKYSNISIVPYLNGSFEHDLYFPSNFGVSELEVYKQNDIFDPLRINFAKLN